MNISEERLRVSLVEHGMSEARALEVIEDLRGPAAETETTTPAASTGRQRVLIVSDPDGRCAGLELTGWVIKVDETQSILEVGQQLRRAGLEHNRTTRNSRNRVTNMGQVIEGVSARVLRDHNIYRQHREAVFVTFVRGSFALDPDAPTPDSSTRPAGLASAAVVGQAIRQEARVPQDDHLVTFQDIPTQEDPEPVAPPVVVTEEESLDA